MPKDPVKQMRQMMAAYGIKAPKGMPSTKMTSAGKSTKRPKARKK